MNTTRIRVTRHINVHPNTLSNEYRSLTSGVNKNAEATTNVRQDGLYCSLFSQHRLGLHSLLAGICFLTDEEEVAHWCQSVGHNVVTSCFLSPCHTEHSAWSRRFVWGRQHHRLGPPETPSPEPRRSATSVRLSPVKPSPRSDRSLTQVSAKSTL